MPYSVTKAAQLHLMRCLASTQGPKTRVNAVLPGWLATECEFVTLFWGLGGCSCMEGVGWFGDLKCWDEKQYCC